MKSPSAQIDLEIGIKNEKWLLLPQKAVYWSKYDMLIVTDLHLGKAGHFRKAGIPIPQTIHYDDLQTLNQLILKFSISKVLMLGDLFHSELNNEWFSFCDFLKQNSTVHFILVKGNHDILPAEAYCEDNLEVHSESLILGPFLFTHHPLEDERRPLYNVAGHIHPGHRVKTNPGQHIKLPSFHFSKYSAILPAYGKFTGCVHVPKRAKDRVCVIVPSSTGAGKVIELRK